MTTIPKGKRAIILHTDKIQWRIEGANKLTCFLMALGLIKFKGYIKIKGIMLPENQEIEWIEI